MIITHRESEAYEKILVMSRNTEDEMITLLYDYLYSYFHSDTEGMSYLLDIFEEITGERSHEAILSEIERR